MLDQEVIPDITIEEKSLKEVAKGHAKYDDRPYDIEDSRHVWNHYYTPKGSKTLQCDTYALCNFTAIIEEEIIRDDGVEQTMAYKINISLCNGSKTDRFIEVPVKQY